jgi:RHS repeat-associated protein
MPLAAKEETLSPSSDPCVLFPLAAFDDLAENSRLGSARKNLALHRGSTWSNSGTALGIEPVLLVEGVRSRYTGKERDGESGLDNFDARYYSPSMGRFISPDWSAAPMGVPYADFGNPQSLNLYSYVKNNPLKDTDPTGHCDPGSPGCALQLVQAINNFANDVGGYVGSFLTGAVKEELSTVRDNLGLSPAPELNPSNDVERAGAALTQGGQTAAAVVLPLVTGGEGEEPGGSFMGPKEGESGGPGAGKDFSPGTKQAVVNENATANGGSARCVYCGDKVSNESGPNKVNVDHAQAKANGGNNTQQNGQVTCQYCNQSKGTSPAPKSPKPKPDQP